MSELRTPDSILRDLSEIRERITRGIEAIRESEDEATVAKFDAERLELTTFLEAQGSVADRQAVAKIRSEDLRRAAETAKKRVDYIREHVRALRDAQMNVQTQARLVEVMYRGAGQGER
jgi:hypothetical protein